MEIDAITVRRELPQVVDVAVSNVSEPSFPYDLVPFFRCPFCRESTVSKHWSEVLPNGDKSLIASVWAMYRIVFGVESSPLLMRIIARWVGHLLSRVAMFGINRQMDVELSRAKHGHQAKPKRQIHFGGAGSGDVAEIENILSFPTEPIADVFRDVGFRRPHHCRRQKAGDRRGLKRD